VISPDTLSHDQKRFLKERYQLDFYKKRMYRNRDRVLDFLRPWPGVILALGLLFEKPSTGSVLPSQPFEIITLGWAAFGIFISWAILITTFAQTRGATSTNEKGKDVWSYLFQDRIRWRPKWCDLRWDVTGTAIGVGLMACLTERIGVGLIWTSGLLSLFTVERLLDRIVRVELSRLTVELNHSGDVMTTGHGHDGNGRCRADSRGSGPSPGNN
jgi:hypothetical protein